MDDSHCEKIKVHARSNDGHDVYQSAENMNVAMEIAKSFGVTTNHMICIEVNDLRIKRWDRDRIEGENFWRATDPEEMETLGKIRVVRRA